ncbi:MAG: hypothetical protein IJX17_03705 [Clostridia bacterium]|nr:hypothetical protein [Clostridia bacterium]
MRRFFKKNIWIIIIMVLVVVFPTGLSNQAKLNMRTIVTGLAIDKTDDGYEVTAQVVKTVSGTESSGIGAEIEFISDNAKTVSKGLAKLLYKAGKFSAFSHTNFIILGKDTLNEDVTKCLDIFLRDKVIKNSAMILFSKEKASDEIKKTKNLELSVGLGLQKVYSFKQEESEGLMMTVLDFLIANDTYGKIAVASVFELQENKIGDASKGGSSSSSGESSSSSSSNSSQGNNESSSSGSSGSSSGGEESGISSDSGQGSDKNSKVNFNANASLYCFHDGKFLFDISNEDEIMGYMITREDTKTSYYELENIECDSLVGVKMTISIKDKEIYKKLRFENEIPCLDIKININNAEVNEVISKYSYSNFTEKEYDAIKESLKKQITDNISKIFEKSKMYKADIFNAYEKAYKFNYKKLKKYYNNEQEFAEKLRLNVSIDIKNMEN